MACTNNNTVKPDVVERPTNIYGAPQGQAGRVFNTVDYGIQGIVLHCTDMTISQYVQYLACLTQAVNGGQETNHHYSIGSAGALNQHIQDANISWTFGNYSAAIYTDPPAPTKSITWPTLQTLNGQNVSPDVYVINILIAKSYNQGTTCLTSSGLPKDQHEKLVQLLAYLSATYDIPLDADHINWHDNIDTQACPSNECNCTDIACLLTDINTFCEEDCNTVTYSEVDCADVSHLLAVPNDCGNSGGCLVSVPFDACCFGDIPIVGDIEQFVGCATDPITGKTCLVKNSVQITTPITGDGTEDNPITVDPCAWGAWVPTYDETGPDITTFLNIDADGCLVQSALADVIPGMETPITVIDTLTVDLTANGTNNHTLQADVNISTATGNLLTTDATGLLVTLDCTGLTGLFETGVLANVYGLDVAGNCVTEPVIDVVDNVLCATTIDDGAGEPMHILGRDIDLTCPIFYTPTQVVFAGLAVEDTLTVDLTMVQDPAVSPLNIITADVIIDPATDNVLEITANGLYVAPIQAEAGDTCLDVQAVDGVITISHIIDPKTENILQCGLDGLCVLDLVPLDTECFEFLYDGVTRELMGRVILAPDQVGVSNVVMCLDDGFYVPRGANAITNDPIVGDGSELNPIDIDFSLMDNQDLCDFGGVIPETLSLVNVIGTDANDCLRLYTGEQFIAQFLNIVNGDCITAILTDNTLTIEPVISPPIGGIDNVLSCVNTGLYVPRGAGIVPQSTNCISLQLVNGVMTATPILDPAEENQLTCTVDGLFVERGAGITGDNTDCIQVLVSEPGVVTATPVISGPILGIANALTCEPGGLFVPVGAGINAINSDCLLVTLEGNGDLTVEPIISPLVDNILECTDIGLYVPDDFITAVADTDCMTLAVTAGVLTAEPIIEPGTNNLLTCGPDGLFANFVVLDTSCINLELNNGVLSADPIIDTVDTNLLTCGVDGLLVELNPDVFVDSNCIDFDVTNGLVTAEPILAPDQGPITNILRCLPDGLYVPVGGGITTLNGSCVELELIAGVLTAEVIIDEVTPDNAITCGPNGLYVEVCCPIVEDTTTVNLTLTDPRTITADVIIDPDATNILVANPNGLYVPPPFITAAIDSNCIDIEVVDGILTINPVISAEPDNALQCLGDGFYTPECCPLVLDTTSIDLTLTGDRTISGVVIIDPDPDNILAINPNGLFVPPQFIDAVLPSPCIDLVVTDGVLSAEPIIDADFDNQLTCGPDGLFVPPCCPLVEDTTSIDLTLTGDRTISGVVIVDPDPDNILAINPDGLFVPPPLIDAVANTQCMELIVTDGVLTAIPTIDPDVTNQLTCGPTGLFVPPAGGITTADTNCIAMDITGTEITAEPIISGPIAGINNALQCVETGLYVPVDFISAVVPHQCINVQVVDGALIVEPIIDPEADNLLTCRGTGLYVPPLDVVDTNCIDLEITGTTLTANPIISAQAENAIQCLVDGFFVQECCPIVTDTQSIDLTLTGIREISADIIIDPDATNALILNPNGLYVAPDFIQAINNTQCITLDVTGNVLTATPVIDPAIDNQLNCGVAGLYVPPAGGITTADTDCIAVDITGTEITAQPILSGPIAGVNNALQCTPTGLYVPVDFISAVVTHQCMNVQVVDGALIVAPIISGIAGNLLSCEADGLYAAPLTAIDTNCIALDITGTTLTANPIISAQADNALTCLADGFYVPECCPIVTDTASVDLTLTGTREISANVILDPLSDNALVLNAAGLYVPPDFIQNVNDTPCITLDVTGNVLTATPVISAAADNAIQCIADGLYVQDCCPVVVDTATVDLTLTGTNTIQADVIIDPAADNVLVSNPAGLFVATPFVTAVADTNCIAHTITAGVLTSDPIISVQANNAIQCLGDGLFIDVPILAVADTDCIDLTLTGGTLTADPVIAPTQAGINNLLSCIPGQGLYVPEGAGLIEADTTSIDMHLVGGVISGDVILDPQADNLIQNNGQGLYVPPLGVIDDQCINLTLVNNVLNANLIIDPDPNNLINCGAAGLTATLTTLDTQCITLTLAGGVLSADPVVAPGPIGGCENALICDATGLFVPELQVLDTNCIDLTLNGCVLSADPIISAEDCNGVECLADGLFVNTDVQAVTMFVTTPSATIAYAPGAMPTAFTEVNRAELTITNPSPCNPMAITRNVPASTLNIDNFCGVAPAVVSARAEASINGGATFFTLEEVLTTVGAGERTSITVPGANASFLQAVGATNDLIVRNTIRALDANFCGEITSGDVSINATGITVIN